MTTIRRCEQCGDPLGTARSNARFCGGTCRQRARRARGAGGQPPKAMLDKPRWVGWTQVRRNGRTTKLPICPSTGLAADVTDPGTWGSYQGALACAGGRVGFVLTEDDDISCVDLDDALVDGQPVPGVMDVIASTPDVFAVEISPSARGLHIWHRGPAGLGTNRVENGLRVERYSRGRYITWTGRICRT